MKITLQPSNTLTLKLYNHMLSIYRLPGKLPGENIIKIIRKDVFILVKKVMFFLLLAVLPALLFNFAVSNVYPNMMMDKTIYAIMILAISFYYLFVWLFFFFSFIDYYLDVWIITNERVIDIQQKGFFSRVISEQRLYRIQDVTSEIHGAIATIFRYGDVHVQTAGTQQRFYFHEVPNPDAVRNEIIALSERSKKRRGVEQVAGNK